MKYICANCNNKVIDITERYVLENQYVNQLECIKIQGRSRAVNPDKIFDLLIRKILSLKNIYWYLREILIGWKYLSLLFKCRNSGQDKKSIVIGNGPSQGYLDSKSLLDFRSNGGVIIAINFWTENKSISIVVPDYLVISDSLTLSKDAPEHLFKKNNNLIDYLSSNNQITILCPLTRCEQIKQMLPKNAVIGFADSELRMWWNNINPIFPRGYLSMTLYKALAMARWFNFNEIFVIGMDNTYPRNIYCDENNHFINHEIHAGSHDYAVDQSDIYSSISDGLFEIAQLFVDARKFSSDRIKNLDVYSLTDAFEKYNYDSWKKNLFRR